MSRAEKKSGLANKNAVRTDALTRALTLNEVQTLIQDAILNRDDRALRLVLDNSRTGRETLFGVYQHGYVGRLVEILGQDYEELKSYLGDADFDQLARAYVSAHPSQSQNARWFGRHMPAFLTRDRRYSGRPELAELATIEMSLSDAFDAVDAPNISIADLAAHNPEDWGRLTFAPHPSAKLLKLLTNACESWKAVKNEVPVPAVCVRPAQSVVVWRHGLTPMIRDMSAEEAMMWVEACRGLRFDAQCEMVAAFDDPDGAALRAAGYLQGWLAAEMLTSAKLTPRPKTATKSKARAGGL